MRLKFKSTTLTARALVYKRFISLEKSANLNTVYKTYDNKLWVFDSENLTFIELKDNVTITTSATYPTTISASTYLQYLTTYFHYNTTNGWVSTTTLPDNITPLAAQFGNIAKYQLNKYYYAGSFDYMMKGSISGTTTQFIKGNIIPLLSFNIKYFNDSINLNVDDLVVVNKRLYSVENPEQDVKLQPKKYSIYFATLNRIL